jgi:hypothetical protein
MAYGRHWEWRGFGTISDETREQLRKLPALFATRDRVTDHYLTLPGAKLNVKLRERATTSLKLKRLEQHYYRTGTDLWVEKPEEEYRFPLSPSAVDTLNASLGLTLPQSRSIGDPKMLVRLVRESGHEIDIISVDKERETRSYAGPLGRGLIELTTIFKPERIDSVGVEDAIGLSVDAEGKALERAQDLVAQVVKEYRLNESLRPMNYLQALEIWAASRSIRDAWR